MDYGRGGGLVGGLGGGAAIAALPNTGGSRSVIADIAILSVTVGVGILASTVLRAIAKRHFNA
jgi:uncharacterized membrane protein YebE (DUF533 family)